MLERVKIYGKNLWATTVMKRFFNVEEDLRPSHYMNGILTRGGLQYLQCCIEKNGMLHDCLIFILLRLKPTHGSL